MPKHVILFLAANPFGTGQLRLDEECREIQRELKLTPHRDDFQFESRWAVTIDELMRHVMETNPVVIHFSGHGNGAGILLHDEQGRSQIVPARALAMLIEAAIEPLSHLRSLQVVVLNACYSAAQAEVLRTRANCIVGMNGAIGDEAARVFAVRFYGALGNRRSVGNAVDQGIAVLAARQLPDELMPRCVTRSGLDAHEIFLGRNRSHISRSRMRRDSERNRSPGFVELCCELHSAFVEATKLRRGQRLHSQRIVVPITEIATAAATMGDDVATQLRRRVARPPLSVDITIDSDRRVRFEPKTAWASFYALPWREDPELDAGFLCGLQMTQFYWRLTPHIDQLPEIPFGRGYEATSAYLEVRHEDYRPEFVPLENTEPRTFTIRMFPVLRKRIAILDFPCISPGRDLPNFSQLIAQEIEDAMQRTPEIATFACFSEEILNHPPRPEFPEPRFGDDAVEVGNEILTLDDVESVRMELESVDTAMISGEGRHLLRKTLDIQFLVRGSYRILDEDQIADRRLDRRAESSVPSRASAVDSVE